MNQPQANGQPQQQIIIQQAPGNGLAVTSLVLGIIGLVLFWTSWVGIILGLLAIIFGAIGAAKRVKRGMAIAGIVLGIIAFILSLWPLLIGAAILSELSSLV
jgi:hypothetical protein